MTETLHLLVDNVAALVAEVRNLNARVRLLQDAVESEVGSQAALALEMFRCERNLRMEAENDPDDGSQGWEAPARPPAAVAG